MASLVKMKPHLKKVDLTKAFALGPSQSTVRCVQLIELIELISICCGRAARPVA